MYNRIRDMLRVLDQEQVIHAISNESDNLNMLVNEIGTVDGSVLSEQIRNKNNILATSTISKIDRYTRVDKVESNIGRRAVENGSVACVLVAGGDGTRLGYESFKGKFPITLIKQKSLFCIFAEKVLIASRRAGKMLDLAIMISTRYDFEIRYYFAVNNYFGLHKEQIHFFVQDDLPFLDDNDNIMMTITEGLIKGPDGNGDCFRYMKRAGIIDKWFKKGIKWVNFVMIDNPLADPFDYKLISHIIKTSSDIVIKCIKRTDPYEKVGVLVKVSDRYQVLEYSEISEKDRIAKNKGRLKYDCANISLFCFAMTFLANNNDLPFHTARKTYNNRIVYKSEKYIFDLLQFTNKTSILMYPREDCFAPIKDDKSIKLVQKALLANDRKIWEKITGINVPKDISFELSADFHYITEEMRSNLAGRSFPDTEYITC